jgi:hypothetical protein
MLNFIHTFGGDVPVLRRNSRYVDGRLPSFQTPLRRVIDRGLVEADMVVNILRAASKKPACVQQVATFLARYEQFRMVLDTIPDEKPRPRAPFAATAEAASPLV